MQVHTKSTGAKLRHQVRVPQKHICSDTRKKGKKEKIVGVHVRIWEALSSLGCMQGNISARSARSPNSRGPLSLNMTTGPATKQKKRKRKVEGKKGKAVGVVVWAVSWFFCVIVVVGGLGCHPSRSQENSELRTLPPNWSRARVSYTTLNSTSFVVCPSRLAGMSRK